MLTRRLLFTCTLRMPGFLKVAFVHEVTVCAFVCVFVCVYVCVRDGMIQVPRVLMHYVKSIMIRRYITAYKHYKF